MPEVCIFCKIVAGEIPARVVAEDEHTLAFMDIAPATPVHLLVIPKRHSADLWEINEDEFLAVARSARELAVLVRDRLAADGVNLINSCRPAAWQTVFHFHIHVIPRYDGDPLKLPWVPEPGDPAMIDTAFTQLR